MTPLRLATGPLAPHSPGLVFKLLSPFSTDMLVSTTLLPNYLVFFSVILRLFFSCWTMTLRDITRATCQLLRGIVIHINYVDLHRFYLWNIPLHSDVPSKK